MSKTVKRAMRAMMIGLVALLGAEAEAHYYVASGKYKYCSLHCAVQLTEVPDPISNPAQVRCEATATLVEIVCPKDQSSVILPVDWVLVGQGQINQSNWNWHNEKANVDVNLPIPLDELSGLCPGKKPEQGDVKILEMPEAEIRVCPEIDLDLGLDLGLDLTDPCPIAASTHTFSNCEISSGSPRGTIYRCDQQNIDHIE
jgi:hypothetical protein